jgi:hypothetical protein
MIDGRFRGADGCRGSRARSGQGKLQLWWRQEGRGGEGWCRSQARVSQEIQGHGRGCDCDALVNCSLLRGDGGGGAGGGGGGGGD